MTLIVEDGTAKDDAQTYQESASIAAYHTARGVASFAALNGTAQDAFNLRAAELMDDSYAWNGTPVSDTQGRRFPRKCLKDRDGRPIASTIVPSQVLRAHAELTLLLSLGAGVGGAFGSTATATGTVKRVKADTVEVEFQAAQQGQASPAPASNVLPDGAGELLDRILFGLYAPAARTMVRLGKS